MLFCKNNYIFINMNPTTTNYCNVNAIADKVVFLDFDDNKVADKYHLDPIDILNLSGGIPTDDFLSFVFVIKSTSDHSLTTYIITEQFKVKRTIFFSFNYIQNDFMIVETKGRGIGTCLFVNQVIESRKQGFSNFEVHAAGGVSMPGDWDGYYFWAKIGYMMFDADEQSFHLWQKRFNTNHTNLNELVKDAKDLQTWKDNGFDWEGYFDLQDGSQSMTYLIEYLNKRSMNITL